MLAALNPSEAAANTATCASPTETSTRHRYDNGVPITLSDSINDGGGSGTRQDFMPHTTLLKIMRTALPGTGRAGVQ